MGEILFAPISTCLAPKYTAKALIQPALVPEVWLAQRDTERGQNFFPCDGLVEIPNFKGPLRDQRLNVGSLPDRLVERFLEGRDVTPLLQDQEDFLLPGFPDGGNLCSRILRVLSSLHCFQDLSVGLTVLRRHPGSVARPSGRRAPWHLALLLGFQRRGRRNFSFLLFFSFLAPTAIPYPFVGSGLW